MSPEKGKKKNIIAVSEMVKLSVSIYAGKFQNNYLEHA